MPFTTPPATTFRDAAWRISPARLRTPKAARLVQAFIGLPLDILVDGAIQALKARFPTDCPEDALAYHSRDRVIPRGPSESSTSFRARLLKWLTLWRGSGVGRVMLDEIAIFLAPETCRIRLWTQVGVVYTREADGTFRVERAAGVWNWDGRADLWSRFWVIIYSTGGVPWSRDGTWGDGELWGEDELSTWGSTATVDEISSIRSIVSERKPAPSVCKKIVVSFDDAAFALSDASPPLPGGLWGNASSNVGGTQSPTRDARAIYWEGTTS